MKRYTTTIFISLVLASSLLMNGCNEETESANVAELSQYVQQGKTYLEQSQFKAAMNSANNAIVIYPDHIDGYIILAQVYNKLGQSSQSIEVLKTFKGIKSSEYYLLLLESYQRSNKIISANKLIQQQATLLSQNEEKFKLLQANALLLEDKSEEAILLYKELQVSEKYKAEGFIGEARMQIKNNDKASALALISQALQVQEKNIEALILKGFLLKEKGNLTDAESTLSFALTVIPSSDIFTPERISILQSLTSILTSQGRSSEALLYSRILTDEFPTAASINEYYASAQVYYEKKEIDLAKKELYKILKINPKHKKASTMLGVIFYTEGDIKGAEKYLSGVIDPEINTPQLTQIYAMTQLKLNQSEDVLTILDDVIDKEKRLDTLILYSVAAISEKKFDKVDLAIARIEMLFPESPKLALLKSSYYSVKAPENNELSLIELEKGLLHNDENLSLQTAYLKKLIAMKEMTKAEEFIQREVEKEQKSLGTNLLIANYYLYRKQFNLAEKHLNAIIKASGDNLEAYYGIAQSKQIQKDWQAAFNQYKEIIRLYPDQVRAYYGAVVSFNKQNKDPLSIGRHLLGKYNDSILTFVLADYQYQNKKLSEASKLILDIKNLPPQLEVKVEKLQQTISSARISIAIKERNYPVAREIVLAQLKATPEQPQFLMRLANIEIRSGQIAEASKVLKQIKSILPDNPQVTLLASQLAIAQNNQQKAISLLENEWNKSENQQVAIALYNLYKSGQKNKANEFLSQWLIKQPNSSMANLSHALYLQSRGDNNEAISAYEKALSVSPNELTSLNNAAWLYSLVNDPQAEVLAERAYRIAPNNAAVLDTYGWILYNLGKYKEAKPLIKKARQLLPDDADIKMHWDLISKK